MVAVKSVVKPAALKPGDRVGLVCPGSRPETPAVVAHAERLVRDMGLQPVTGKHVLSISGFMAGTDAERLSDLVSFLTDDSIAGIFCITGGYGALHLLPRIDYDAVARHPKVLIGCDDNTALLNAITERTGVVTLHGPNLDQIRSRSNFDRFLSAVTTTSPAALSANGSGPDDVYARDFYCPVDGTVEGRLVGGNLTAFTSLLGTPFEPQTKEAILFFEDINEQNGILDRWFTTLYLGGHLQVCSGVAFGSFENCKPGDSANMLSVMDTFSDRLKYLQTTSCFGLPFGQTKDTSVVPIGIRAKLHAAQGRLELLEPALS